MESAAIGSDGPNYLSVPIIAKCLCDSANWLTQKSVQMPGEKAKLPKKEPRTAA